MIFIMNNAWVLAQKKGKKSSGKSKLRDEALKWCDKWIEKSLRCKPPNSKIEKFQHRFQKVVDDAVWHAEGAKRCPTRKPVKYRRRRDGNGKLDKNGRLVETTDWREAAKNEAAASWGETYHNTALSRVRVPYIH